MKKALAAQLTSLNQAYKELDDVYHNYAKENGLSDTAFWVLYSLWECEEAFTQRELCAAWSYSPQTVNSALKLLEHRDLIYLEKIAENRKHKHIFLTESGTALGKTVIAPLLKAERTAFSELSQQERTELLSTTQRHIALLKQEINRISTVSSEDCSPQ